MLRSRVIYIVLLLASIGFYIFFGQYIAFATMIFVISLPLFLYVITVITSFFIKVGFGECDSVAQKQEEQNLEITIDNESFLHISSAKLTLIKQNEFLNKKSKEYIVFPIGANQVTTVKTKVVSQYCGNIELGIKKIKLYDFLALTSYTKRAKKSIRMAVLPNVYEIEQNVNIAAAPDDESSSYSMTKSGDDSSQVFDYHEYRDGDKMKNIHWKLSTKLDKMMVKELSLPISSAVCIAFEFGAEKNSSNQLSLIDIQMDILFSLSSWLFFGGVSHEIEWYNPAETCGEKMQISTVDSLFFAIEELYHTKPHMGELLLNEIADRTVKMKFSHLFYITTAITQNTINRISALKEKVNVTVIYSSQEERSLSSERIKELSILEIGYIEVNAASIESDLQNISL